MDKVFEIESIESFENLLQQLLTNLYYTSPTSSLLSYLEADAIVAAKQDLISIISECDFDVNKILEVFNSKGWQSEKVECFRDLIEKNKAEVLYAAFNHYNSNYCETVIKFDWFVKFILGTSELKTFKYPLLQLVMSTLNKNKNQHKIIYDIKKDELLKMISALESIK